MLKRYLLAPGPTPVPPEVLLAMARPMIHHRAPDFREVYERVVATGFPVPSTRATCVSSLRERAVSYPVESVTGMLHARPLARRMSSTTLS